MKRIVVYLVLILGCSLASCHKSKTDEKESAYMMEVNVCLPVVDSVLLYKTYPGKLTAQSEVNLVARVNGYLQRADYKAGDYVKKGQLLFVIEPKPYQEAVLQAESQLASAKSQKEYARSNYESMKEAAQSNAVSQIDLVQAESNWQQTVAAVKSAEAALETAKLNLEYCYIRAPFNGRITKKNMDIGNYLNGNASPQILATIYDDRTMTVTFAIEDSQYMRMLNDRQKTSSNSMFDNVILSFNETLPHNYSGTLNYLSPMVDLSTGTVTLQAKVDNDFGELKSGMYCVVSLPYKKETKAILINDAAIGTDQLGKFIYTINDSNRVEYTPIEVGGLVGDTLRIVSKGVSPNTKYVIQAMQKVREGMMVKPILSK